MSLTVMSLPFFHEAVLRGGNDGGAGAGAAGHGLPVAPFVHPHPQGVLVDDADKLGVDPVREVLGVLELGP